MPQIAIVGRQNVGKSTLFNALIGKRKSIVYNSPGVTRDLISHDVDWGEGRWIVTDFPGFEKISLLKDDLLTLKAVENAREQLSSFHAIIWVVSVKGLEPLDDIIAKDLRKSGKPVFLAANFADDTSHDENADDLFRTGFSDITFISALNKRNIGNLKEKIVTHFEGSKKISAEHSVTATDESPAISGLKNKEVKIAIIGKPNTGKSTLFNWFLKKEKALTSNIAGTTRDSLEETFKFEDRIIRIVDTAGLRRRRSVSDDVEKFSVQRATDAITAADGIYMTMDPDDGFDKQNKTILNLALAAGKPLVLLINKYDLVKDDPDFREKMDSQIERARKLFWPFPVYYVSAIDGTRVTKAVERLLELIETAKKSVPTPALNRMLNQLKKNHILANNRITPKYVTWDSENLKLILFAGYREVPDNIERFILNEMRKQLGKTELPVKIEIRNKSKD